MPGCEFLRQVPKIPCWVPGPDSRAPRRHPPREGAGGFQAGGSPTASEPERLLNEICLHGYPKCLTCFICSLQTKHIFTL